jgi:hypothetical protein
MTLPIALSDKQLSIIMVAATPLPPEKRALLLERIAAHLLLHGRRAGRRFDDAAVELAVRSSLQGLAQSAA